MADFEYVVINDEEVEDDSSFELLTIGNKTIINNKISDIFKIRNENNYSYIFTYCYNFSDYISDISLPELRKQFYIDVNRINLTINNKSANITKFIKYIKSLNDKQLRKIIFLFCSQILYSKIIISIQQIFMSNYIVSELSDKSIKCKSTRVNIKNGNIYSSKKLRVVCTDHDKLETIYNFELTFSLNMNKRMILKTLINIYK